MVTMSGAGSDPSMAGHRAPRHRSSAVASCANRTIRVPQRLAGWSSCSRWRRWPRATNTGAGGLPSSTRRSSTAPASIAPNCQATSTCLAWRRTAAGASSPSTRRFRSRLSGRRVQPTSQCCQGIRRRLGCGPTDARPCPNLAGRPVICRSRAAVPAHRDTLPTAPQPRVPHSDSPRSRWSGSGRSARRFRAGLRGPPSAGRAPRTRRRE